MGSNKICVDPLSAEATSHCSAGCPTLLQVPTVFYFLSAQEVAMCLLPVKEPAGEKGRRRVLSVT